MRFVLTLVVALAAATASAHAAGPELAQLYAAILRDPTNPALNLRYAQWAEESGKLRWALATYERMILNDPANEEAQRGLQRIRRKLQPDSTQFTAELGSAWESNPRYRAAGGRGELQATAAGRMRDERRLGDMRWRTGALAIAQVHQYEGELNYGYAGLSTGPVIDVGPGLTLHPALGAAAAYFDHRLYYGEAAASVTLEGNLQGSYRAVQVRAAYRDYNDFFPSQRGFYVDVTGKFSVPNVIGSGSLLLFSPWLRWSDIAGSGTSAVFTEIQPGAYAEIGGRVEFYQAITAWMFAGPTLALSQRTYRTDLVPGTADKRRDTIFAPGATVTLPNLFAYQTGLRLDYKYLHDRSNDSSRSFTDHVIAATVVARF
jgi:hypothetical protein